MSLVLLFARFAAAAIDGPRACVLITPCRVGAACFCVTACACGRASGRRSRRRGGRSMASLSQTLLGAPGLLGEAEEAVGWRSSS